MTQGIINIATDMSKSADDMMGLDVTLVGDEIKDIMRHHDLVLYLHFGHNVGDFIISMIILLLGALYQPPNGTEVMDPTRFAYPFIKSFSQLMQIIFEGPITQQSLRIVSDLLTFFLDIGIFTHLARYILLISQGCKVYFEAVLFWSLYIVEMILHGCYKFTDTTISQYVLPQSLVLRVIQELARSSLLTIIIKELMELPINTSKKMKMFKFDWLNRIDSICNLLALIMDQMDLQQEVSIAMNSEGMQGLCMAMLTSLSLMMDRYDGTGFNGLLPSNPLLQRFKIQYTKIAVNESDASAINLYVLLLYFAVKQSKMSGTTTVMLITKKRLAYICQRIMDFPEGNLPRDNKIKNLKPRIYNLLMQLEAL